MRRELLLLEEMIDAAEQAHLLAVDQTPESLAADRQRRDALLWNFTVLGEAAAQLPDDFKAHHPEIPWQQPSRLRNRIVHGYWSIDLEILITTAAERLPGMVAQLGTPMRHSNSRWSSSTVRRQIQKSDGWAPARSCGRDERLRGRGRGSRGDDDLHAGCGEGGAERLGWCRR
jgi:uncharacterized protein with HEPN domain